MRLAICVLLLAACGDSAATADAQDISVAPDITATDTSPAQDIATAADNTQPPDAEGPATDTTAADATDTTAADSGPTARTGLEGHCDRYRACGGTYYESAEACVQATIDYWTECRRPQLDAFGDCMNQLSCEIWGDPDGFIPANTPCNREWEAIEDADCD